MSDTSQNQGLQIDPNHVINSLLQQNAALAKDKAIAEAAYNSLVDALKANAEAAQASQNGEEDGGAAVPAVTPAAPKAPSTPEALPVPVA